MISLRSSYETLKYRIYIILVIDFEIIRFTCAFFKINNATF